VTDESAAIHSGKESPTRDSNEAEHYGK
jgi:hypothetical protein